MYVSKLAHRLPVNFAEYMQTALYDQEIGYYAANTGYHKDFVTAPIHSEYLAFALANWLSEHGYQSVVELGPGRGDLASQISRFCREKGHHIDKYILEERSGALRAHQAKMLAKKPFVQQYAPREAPVDLLLANEILDAQPARRFKWLGGDHVQEWQLVQEGDRCIVAWQDVAVCAHIDACLKSHAKRWSPGYVFELCDYNKVFDQLVASGAQAALFIDYGYEAHDFYEPSLADGRLKVFSKHHLVPFDPASIGQVDLTFPVNWTDCESTAQLRGFKTKAFGRLSDFLLHYGALDYLTNGRSPEQSAKLKSLLMPNGMGESMQVLWLVRE